MESREVKFTLVPNPLPPIQQICSSMYIHGKCLIVCASTGLESETVLSSLLVSCACERRQSLIAWVFMQTPSNGDYIYWKWDSHIKAMKFHVGLKSQTILG